MYASFLYCIKAEKNSIKTFVDYNLTKSKFFPIWKALFFVLLRAVACTSYRALFVYLVFIVTVCIHHVYKRSFFHVYIIQTFVFLKKNICSLQLKFMKVMIRFLPKFFKEIPVAKVSAIRLSCLQTPASFCVNSNFFFFLIVYITQLKRSYFFQIAQF